MTRSYLSTCLLLLSAGLLPARQGHTQFPSVQKLAEEQQSWLPVDYAVFAGDSAGLVRLEVYYRIYNRALQFERTDGQLEARYEMAVVVTEGQGVQVAAHRENKRILAGTEDQATSRGDYRTQQKNFELSPSKYRVLVTLTDKNSRTVLKRDFDVKLEDRLGKYPTLSDIELVDVAEKSRADAGSFTKGDLALVPSVTGRFSGAADGRLLYYVEIYQGREGNDHVRIETILRENQRKMVYRDSLTVNFAEPLVRQLREVSLADFSPGEYELEITLRGRRNKKLDAQSRNFRIAWSAEALLKHDYETAIEQLTLISSSVNVKELKKLKTPQERRAAFDRFWKEIDPTPGTPENELKDEFYQRVATADQRFSVMRREGWRTDRGRIYIQFGEPDQIDDYPLNPVGSPLQEWHYFRHGPYRRFTFVDEHEDGDYRLQYPYDGLR